MPKRKPDHVPMRTCAVCRQVRPKRSMTRIVRAPDGTVTVDRTGKAAGRGTYVCEDSACREPMQLAAGIQRALSVQVAPGTLDLEEIHATS